MNNFSPFISTSLIYVKLKSLVYINRHFLILLQLQECDEHYIKINSFSLSLTYLLIFSYYFQDYVTLLTFLYFFIADQSLPTKCLKNWECEQYWACWFPPEIGWIKIKVLSSLGFFLIFYLNWFLKMNVCIILWCRNCYM